MDSKKEKKTNEERLNGSSKDESKRVASLGKREDRILYPKSLLLLPNLTVEINSRCTGDSVFKTFPL